MSVSLQRRRWVGAAVLVTLGAGLVIARCAGGASRSETQLEVATVALRAALHGEPSRFAEAREAFSEAAGGVVFDPYPVFALEVVRLLEAPEPTERVAPELLPVLAAWRARRLDEAMVLAAKLPASLSGAGFVTRLATDLVRVGARK